MAPDHDSRLRLCADVAVRIGLNLQPGQRLLVAEPYELQGVSREASELVEAVSSCAAEAGCPHIAVQWSDAVQLRRFAEQADWRGFTRLVTAHASQMEKHLADGGAFLFPLSSSLRLMHGIPATRVSELQKISWTHFGPIIQRLTRGESQWSIIPASTPAWANAVFADIRPELRIDALNQTVFDALRIPGSDTASSEAPSERENVSTTKLLKAWRDHLATLECQCSELNARRYKTMRYQGPGTDLTIKLPAQHQWCTAQLTTKSGIAFVANLPTEEVFTAPAPDSAEGVVRVGRPVSYGGSVIDGIELEFHRGRVTRAGAHTGEDLLRQLLDTDDGSSRLGETALVIKTARQPNHWQNSGRLFQHTLLDENASNHIALGESYRFCNRSLFGFGLNRSLVHVDLPLEAAATFA